ncbi:MAG: AlpA family phage regulatory protein [Alphaproteobacteria bacterium]|nr:AlpA family phage regulatory protein [Alphaproteobacteria bacterium]
MGNAQPIQPALLGYKQLEQKLGLSRSSIERMVRAGTFPKPFKPTPNRRAWTLDAVDAWLKTQHQGLVDVAVTDPNDLDPVDFAPAMKQLAARMLSTNLDRDVSPDQIRLFVERRATNEEATCARAEFLERFEVLCGGFEHDRALLVAASVFPAIREQLCADGASEIFHAPERLRDLAIDALDDDLWEWFAVEAARYANATAGD